MLVGVASQRLQLALGELPAGILEGAKPTGAHQGGDGRAGQYEGLPMVQAVTRARVGELAESIQQAFERGPFQGTGAGHVGFVGGQRLGEAGLTQELAGARLQGAQAKLFWLVVRQVEVAAVARESTGRSDGLEAAGPIARAAILRFVDKALDHEDLMPPPLLPVPAQTTQAQTENPRPLVGIALAGGQKQIPAVVHHETEATGTLAWRPTNPALASLQMQRCGAEADRSQPQTIEFRDVVHVLPGADRVVQVVPLPK